MSLKEAVRRATLPKAPPKKDAEVELDPFEIAVEEFSTAKSAKDKAEALRAAFDLAKLSK